MKVIDCRSAGAGRGTSGAPRSILNQVQAISHKATAADDFYNALGHFLDNRYVLVDGAELPGSVEPLPPVLFGPTGLWLINIADTVGVFRANGESWEQLDGKTGRYRPHKPNPIIWTVEKSRLVTDYIGRLQKNIPTVEPVIYFSAADAHIELARPAVRVVLVDGVQRFINTILSAQPVLDRETIQTLTDLLCPAASEAKKLDEIADSFSLQEAPAPKPPRTPTRLETIARGEPQVVAKISRKLSLSRKQWIWIGILIAVNITILILLIFIVALNT